jgi:endonuclease G
MAFVSAANIDAKRYITVDRDTGEPKVGAEGESWYDDDRMDPKNTIGQDFYGAWSTYFDRGHLTRRSDPTWGTAAQATRANTDTYHRTNCTPQHFRFNESIRYWQGLERYVLEFGVLKTQARVTVLTGPVLDNDNVSVCDDVNVPLLFWKVLLRVGPKGSPQASAYLVSQEKIIGEQRVALKPPSGDQVPKIDTFRYSIAKLAELTGLDFSAFAGFDTFKTPAGAEAAPRAMTAWEDAL